MGAQASSGSRSVDSGLKGPVRTRLQVRMELARGAPLGYSLLSTLTLSPGPTKSSRLYFLNTASLPLLPSPTAPALAQGSTFPSRTGSVASSLLSPASADIAIQPILHWALRRSSKDGHLIPSLPHLESFTRSRSFQEKVQSPRIHPQGPSCDHFSGLVPLPAASNFYYSLGKPYCLTAQEVSLGHHLWEVLSHLTPPPKPDGEPPPSCSHRSQDILRVALGH